jgi:predicted nucleic acid-binding protein
MTAFLLDTDVVSNLSRPRKSLALMRWLDQSDPGDLGTTVVTISEIACGIQRQRNLGNTELADGLDTWFSQLMEIGTFRIHPLQMQAAVVLGRMCMTPALRNFVVFDPRTVRPNTAAADLAIAAIAIAHGAVVVTGNVSHFEAIHACFPLPGLYDPFNHVWPIGGPV